MKKLILTALLLVLCVAMLASCGDSKPTVTTDDDASVTVPTKGYDITTAPDETEDVTTAPAETTEAVEDTTEAAEDTTDVTVPAETTADAPAKTDAPVTDKTPAKTTEATTTAKAETPAASADEVNPADVSAALEKQLEAFKSYAPIEGSYLANSAFAGEDAATFEALFAKFTYTLGEVKVIDGNTATVEAKMTMVDVGAALTAYMTEIMAHSNEDDWDSDFAVFYDLLSGENAVLKDYDVTIKMTKDANGWDISDDGNDDFKNVISGGLLSSDLLS
ncbi:MAG: hypothetical protein IJA60_04410 [Clostridia bacterium]|nr:hypothetical protein [Clostridia bacterium]